MNIYGFTIKVTGQDSIGQFIAECLEVPGALGYGGTPEEARLSSMRAILPIIKAREEQKDAKIAEARADADALAGALESVRDRIVGESKKPIPEIDWHCVFGLPQVIIVSALASRPEAARKRAEGQA